MEYRQMIDFDFIRNFFILFLRFEILFTFNRKII
jgi:hypothetical protein